MPLLPLSSLPLSDVALVVGAVVVGFIVVESSTIVVIDVVGSVSLVVPWGPPQMPWLHWIPSPHCASALHGSPVALPPSKHAIDPNPIQAKHA